MLLDPFTIIAQIINFAILVYALKHFLYDRVLSAMDQREASIAARLRDAEEREAIAAQQAADFEERRVELENHQQELLNEARAEANRRRTEMLADARGEVDQLRDRWEQGLRAEQRETEQELRRRTAREVVALSRRTLGDVAGVELERIVVDLALDHLASDPTALDGVAGRNSARHTEGPAPLVVRTAFDLAPELRQRVIERLRSLGLAEAVTVDFERNEQLILGVEFDGRGSAVSWHAADYLERLDEHIRRVMLETDGPIDG